MTEQERPDVQGDDHGGVPGGGVMSVRAAVTNLRCDQTRTNNDNATELRCLSEIQLVGDFDSVRAEAARSGWMRVRGREPWVSDLWFDICPICHQHAEEAVAS